MGFLIRRTLVEARLAHHGTTWWLWGAVAFWVVLVRLQEPARFRQNAAWFFWPSIELVLVAAIGSLPLLWTLVRREGPLPWTVRQGRSPIETVVSAWLGIAAYGLAAASSAVIIIYTVDSILGIGSGVSALMLLLGELTLLACCTAALAPALAAIPLSTGRRAMLWVALLLASTWIGFPVPVSSLLILQEADPTMARLAPAAVLASVQATAGGLFLSTALIHRHLRHDAC